MLIKSPNFQSIEIKNLDMEEEGIIRCICGYDHDDGFTIQCEKCFVWQHAACLGIRKDRVPDEYFCDLCQPRVLDYEVLSHTY